MEKQIVLKPCPSCGAEAKIERYVEMEGFIVDSLSIWRVRCKYCSFKCDGFQFRSNAIRRWNTRTKEPKS